MSRPEVILSSPDGWRLMMIVAQNQPHLALYDANDDARLHLTVDRRGIPHVRRHFWRWLIGKWRWYGYYPRDGAGDR